MQFDSSSPATTDAAAGNAVRATGPAPAAATAAAPATATARAAHKPTLLPLAIAAIPLAIVVTTVVILGPSGYTVLDRSFPGLPTSLLSAVLRTTAELASTVCIGALVYTAFIRPKQGEQRFAASWTDLSIVRWSSLVWAGAALLLIAVDAADAGGQPITRLATPGALLYLVQGSYLPGAWIFATVIALAIFCSATLVRTWQTTVLLAALALLAILAPVVVTQVLVGPNHDWGSDAAIFGTPAAAVWIGTTLVIGVRWARTGTTPSLLTRTRYVRLSIVCAAVVAVTQVIIAAFELATPAGLATPTAALFGVKFLLLAALGALALRIRRTKQPMAAAGRAPIITAAILLSTSLGITVAMTRIAPPVYFVPTSVAQLFLGYDITPAPTLDRLFFDWRPSILFIALAAAGVLLYLWGVVRLRRRGDPWPLGRTVAWVLGWVAIVLTTSSGLGRYSSVSFSLHMLLHMSLNMLGPLLLVLGGAATLALRATTPRRRDQPTGPHEWITALLNWKFTHAVSNPLWVFVAFVGSYYLLYLTPIFGEALRYHWAHQVMNLHFIGIGYLFYGLVIGVDKPPRPLPHIGKLGLVLAAMPFHAFFGVIIMSDKTIIAELFYRYIGAPWMTDLAQTQYVGGGIAWAAGELPLIVVVIALVTQWARQDAKQAKRVDRHLDSGIDDSFDAYNAMLEQLSKRETNLQTDTKTESEPA